MAAATLLLTRKEHAELLRISTDTVDDHVEARRLPHYKLGRRTLFDSAEILELIRVEKGGDA